MKNLNTHHHKYVRVTSVLQEFCRVTVDLNNTNMVEQQFDAVGNHRLVCGKYSSEWVSYQGISALTIFNVGMFRGTSEYYQDVLPRIFQLINPLILE